MLTLAVALTMITMAECDGLPTHNGTIPERPLEVCRNNNNTVYSEHFKYLLAILVRQWTYLQCSQFGQLRITQQDGMFGNRVTERYRHQVCTEAFGPR